MYKHCCCGKDDMLHSQFYFEVPLCCSAGFRPAIACLENLKDNPSCHPVELPSDYYHSANVFHIAS